MVNLYLHFCTIWVIHKLFTPRHVSASGSSQVAWLKRLAPLHMTACEPTTSIIICLHTSSHSIQPQFAIAPACSFIDATTTSVHIANSPSYLGC